MSTLIPSQPQNKEQAFALLLNMTVSRLDSANSRTAYRSSLDLFFRWLDERPFDWTSVNQFRVELIASGLASATVNMRLCAVRKLAETAFLAKVLPHEDYERIRRVNNVRVLGVRMGTWLTKEQMQQLLDAPDAGKNRLKATRDKAMLGVLMGCGIRREEICALRVEHFRKVKGAWTLADLLGKGNRTRTIPMGEWCAELIQRWLALMLVHAPAHDGSFPLFPRLKKSKTVEGEVVSVIQATRMSTQNVYKQVAAYGKEVGLEITPHDLRRSFARLADDSGAKLKEIRMSLGHSSLSTTELYLGHEQSFTESPGQSFSMEINK